MGSLHHSSGLEVVPDKMPSEEPQQSSRHTAEEIQVPVCLFAHLICHLWLMESGTAGCVLMCLRARRRWQQKQKEAQQWEEELKYQVRVILQSGR